MTLNPHPHHLAAGAYVLRLHRDARPEEGLLMGRIQHLASGDWVDFTSAGALLDWLSRHSAHLRAESREPEETERSRGGQPSTDAQTLTAGKACRGGSIKYSRKEREQK